MEILKFKQYEAINPDDIQVKISDELVKEFIDKYNKPFIEIFKNAFNDIRNILIETINTHNIEIYNDDTNKFIDMLSRDLNDCKQYVENELNDYDVKNYMESGNDTYEKYCNNKEKYFEEIFKIIVHEYKISLGVFLQKKYDEKIGNNPELWKKLRSDIYDYKIINKYKHLNDADNFDLI